MAATTNKGFGLLFEMGCGKTRTAIAIAGAAYQKGAIQRVLVIAPTSSCRLAKRDRRSRRLQSDLQGAPGNEATEDPND